MPEDILDILTVMAFAFGLSLLAPIALALADWLRRWRS